MLKLTIKALTLLLPMFLISCTQNEKLEQFDQISKQEGETLNQEMKLKACLKSEQQNKDNQHKVTELLWKQASKRDNNKIKKSFIRDNWMSFIIRKDDGSFGHNFSQVRNLTLINIRYAKNIECSWVNKSI